MFISERTKLNVQAYIARPDIKAIIAQKETQEVLREALRSAREFAEQRRMSSEVNASLVSQRVSM